MASHRAVALRLKAINKIVKIMVDDTPSLFWVKDSTPEMEELIADIALDCGVTRRTARDYITIAKAKIRLLDKQSKEQQPIINPDD